MSKSSIRWLLFGLAACGGQSGSDGGPSGSTAASTTATGATTGGPGATAAPDSTADSSTATGSATGSPQCGDPSAWLDRPTFEQVAAMREAQLCCADLSAAYLARVREGDAVYNAVVALDDAASADARMLDATLADAGPLHCAIIMIKDNIDSEGVATTAGSLAMVANVAAADAPLVANLRAAGGLILGKTNLSEWANFRGNGSSSGWSSFGGQTHNGSNASRNPCGSSSGSAAAVAAGLVSAAVGTETSGSIVCPSSVNGVVGHKPTLGLVSRTGVIPIAHSHDTAGPITRTVRDAALVLAAMAGPDSEDPATAEIPSDFDYDFTGALDRADLEGVRLGYDAGFAAQFSNEQTGLFEEQLTRLEAAGAIVIEVSLPGTGGLGGAFGTVLTTEFKADLNAYLAAHTGRGVPTSLAELIDFNAANADEVMPYFGQELFVAAEATNGLDDPGYLDALALVKQQAGPLGLLAVLDGDELDAIVLPTTGPAWVTNYQSGDSPGPSSAFLPAAAGYPHLTVPMGQVTGLPVGLSLIGRPWDDAAILAIGHAYEQLP